MQLPYELLWGVDIAIKKLRPNANFQLEGSRFTIWDDPTDSQPPSWDEIREQLARDEQAAKEWLEQNQ